MAARRVLIVGGAGFIGAHLAAAHAAAGDQVGILVRWGTTLDRIEALGLSVDAYRVQLTKRDEVDCCLADARPDIVYFLASGIHRVPKPGFADALDSIHEDLAGLVTLLAGLADRPPKAFVRTGSLAEYGSAAAPYEETVREQPTTSHGTSLVCGTHYLNALAPRLPFPVTTARMALVYGPMQSSGFLVPMLIGNCLAGVETRLMRPGDRRDLMHVDDAVRGLMALAACPAPPPILNLATGIAPTVEAIARCVVDVSGCDPRLVSASKEPSVGGMTDFRGATARAREAIGFAPRIAYREGIAAEVSRQQRMALGKAA